MADSRLSGIVRVKDTQGNWVPIQSVVGPTGPTGPTGPSGGGDDLPLVVVDGKLCIQYQTEEE